MKKWKYYKIHYNDGAYYGTLSFLNKSRKQIQRILLEEIKDNNKNPNKNYHIGFKNIKRSYS